MLERDLARAVSAAVVDHQGIDFQPARLRRDARKHRPDTLLLVQGGDDRDDRREREAGVALRERADGPIAHLWDIWLKDLGAGGGHVRGAPSRACDPALQDRQSIAGSAADPVTPHGGNAAAAAVDAPDADDDHARAGARAHDHEGAPGSARRRARLGATHRGRKLGVSA
jgi:hypothetical protein